MAKEPEVTKVEATPAQHAAMLGKASSALETLRGVGCALNGLSSASREEKELADDLIRARHVLLPEVARLETALREKRIETAKALQETCTACGGEDVVMLNVAFEESQLAMVTLKCESCRGQWGRLIVEV